MAASDPTAPPEAPPGAAPLRLAEAYCLGSALALQVLCARFLGPADYGRFAVLRTVELWGTVVLVGGVPQALRRAVAIDRANLPAAVRWALGLQFPVCLAAALLIAALAGPAGRLIGDPDLAVPLRVSALGLAIQAGLLEPMLNIINGLGRFGLQLRVLLVFGTLRVLLPAWAAARTGDLSATLAASAVATLAATGAAALSVLRIRRGVAGGASFPMGREILAWVGLAPAYEAITLGLLASNLWLVKSGIADVEAVGRYSACYLVAQVPLAAARVAAGAAFSALAAADARRDAAGGRTAVGMATRELILVLAPAVAAAAMLGDEGLGILLGPRYARTGGLVGILMLAAAFYAVAALLGSVLGAVGRQRERLLAVLPAALLGLPATACLIRWRGMDGAGWGLLLTAALAMVPLACLVRYRVGPSFQTASAAKAAVAAAAMAATISCLRALGGPLASPPAALVAGALGYGCCLGALGVPVVRSVRGSSHRTPPPRPSPSRGEGAGWKPSPLEGEGGVGGGVRNK